MNTCTNKNTFLCELVLWLRGHFYYITMFITHDYCLICYVHKPTVSQNLEKPPFQKIKYKKCKCIAMFTRPCCSELAVVCCSMMKTKSCIFNYCFLVVFFCKIGNGNQESSKTRQ